MTKNGANVQILVTVVGHVSHKTVLLAHGRTGTAVGAALAYVTEEETSAPPTMNVDILAVGQQLNQSDRVL